MITIDEDGYYCQKGELICKQVPDNENESEELSDEIAENIKTQYPDNEIYVGTRERGGIAYYYARTKPIH